MSTLDVSDPTIRMSGLGGSDAATAVGKNPYKTALELYLEKAGEIPDTFEGNEATKWGNILEEPVAQAYAEATGSKVARVNRTLRNEAYPWAFAHVDRRVLNTNPTKGLEVKTGGFYSMKDWGDEGTDEVPLHYLLQVQHYLGVTGWSGMDVAALLNTSDFRIYVVPRNETLIAVLMEKEAEFWRRVQERDPPEPQTLGDCDLRWSKSLGEVAYADDGIRDAVLRLAALKAEIKELTAAATDERIAISKAIGDAESLVHKSDPSKAIVTWKSSRSFDERFFREAHPDLWEEHSRPKLDRKSLEKAERKLYAEFKSLGGSRRFLLKV